MARLTFAILLLITAAALFFFGVVSAWQDVRALQAEVNQFEAVNTELETIQQKRDQLTEDYNTISAEDLSKLSLMLPADFGTSQFLLDMEALAGQRAVFLKNIDFLKAEKPGGAQIQLPSQRLYAPIGLSFTMRGTYESLRAFLRDLENMVRVTDISEISFTAGQTAGAGAVFDYALRGTTYYLR